VTHTLSQRFASLARGINTASASPFATVFVLIFIIGWAVLGPVFHFSDTWQLAMNTTSSIITFLMVFILNNAQSHDTRAMNLKLDELIRSIEDADNRVIALEAKPVPEAEQVAEAIKAAIDELPVEAQLRGSSLTVKRPSGDSSRRSV
jgi:low affinity Fe/Cu permease